MFSGPYPKRFILPELVSYLGERGVLCVGNGWRLCTPVVMNMCDIKFEVPRLSTFVLKQSSEKKYLRSYSWLSAWRVLVGIKLAQRRRRWPNIISQLGQCIVLSGCWPFGDKASRSRMAVRANTGQSPNSVSMVGRRQIRLTGVTVSDYPLVQVTPGGNLKLVSSYPI